MTNWVDVIDAASFPVGSYQVFDWNGLSLLVFNLNGEFFAIKNVCPHQGAPLCQGSVHGTDNRAVARAVATASAASSH